VVAKNDSPEKLATYGTQDEEKQSKNTTWIGHHYAQTNKQPCIV
jgi:hypothetical protein